MYEHVPSMIIIIIIHPWCVSLPQGIVLPQLQGGVCYFAITEKYYVIAMLYPWA